MPDFWPRRIDQGFVHILPNATGIATPVVSAIAGDGAVLLAFGTQPGVSYAAYVSTTAGGEAPPAAGVTSGTGGTGSIQVSGLVNGTTYYFVVEATDAIGQTAKSAEVTAVPGTSALGATGTVDTIQDMRNLLAGFVPTSVLVRGRDAVDDGGGGWFIRRPAGSARGTAAVDNTGTVVITTATGWVWDRLVEDAIESVWFVGAGPSLDSAAGLQKFFDAIPDGGRANISEFDYYVTPGVLVVNRRMSLTCGGSLRPSSVNGTSFVGRPLITIQRDLNTPLSSVDNYNLLAGADLFLVVRDKRTIPCDGVLLKGLSDADVKIRAIGIEGSALRLDKYLPVTRSRISSWATGCGDSANLAPVVSVHSPDDQYGGSYGVHENVELQVFLSDNYYIELALDCDNHIPGRGAKNIVVRGLIKGIVIGIDGSVAVQPYADAAGVLHDLVHVKQAGTGIVLDELRVLNNAGIVYPSGYGYAALRLGDYPTGGTVEEVTIRGGRYGDPDPRVSAGGPGIVQEGCASLMFTGGYRTGYAPSASFVYGHIPPNGSTTTVPVPYNNPPIKDFATTFGGDLQVLAAGNYVTPTGAPVYGWNDNNKVFTLPGTFAAQGSVSSGVQSFATANTAYGLFASTSPIVTAGSGYQVGDIVTVVGGTVASGQLPSSFVVNAVNGSGGATALGINAIGVYVTGSTPPSTVSVAGGHGTGLTISMLWVPGTVFILAGRSAGNVEIDCTAGPAYVSLPPRAFGAPDTYYIYKKATDTTANSISVYPCLAVYQGVSYADNLNGNQLGITIPGVPNAGIEIISVPDDAVGWQIGKSNWPLQYPKKLPNLSADTTVNVPAFFAFDRVYFEYLSTNYYVIDWNQGVLINQVPINVKGTGYTVNDVLTINIPGATVQPSVQVTNVNGSGGVTFVVVQNFGRFETGAFTNGQTFTGATVTGGTGTGATFDVKLSANFPMNFGEVPLPDQRYSYADCILQQKINGIPFYATVTLEGSMLLTTPLLAFVSQAPFVLHHASNNGQTQWPGVVTVVIEMSCFAVSPFN